MFNLRLKELRENAGWSQAQLAKKLQVGQSTVGMWENGKNMPQNAKLEMLATLFGVSTDYLLGRSDTPNGVTDDSTDAVTDDELMQMREDMRRNPELRTLFSLTKGASKQEMRQLEGIVRALRGSNDHEEDTDGA